jgi:hypothetical protein
LCMQRLGFVYTAHSGDTRDPRRGARNKPKVEDPSACPTV